MEGSEIGDMFDFNDPTLQKKGSQSVKKKLKNQNEVEIGLEDIKEDEDKTILTQLKYLNQEF